MVSGGPLVFKSWRCSAQRVRARNLTGFEVGLDDSRPSTREQPSEQA